MLTKMRSSWLLFTILALIACTSALDIGVDGIAEYFHHGKRQAASGTGNVTPSTSAVPSTSTPVTTPTPTPTPTPTTQPSTESQSSQAPSSAPSSAVSSTPAPSSAAPTSKATSKSSQKSTEIFTSALLGTSVQQYTTVITTVSDGQTQELTSTGSRTLVSTTGQALITKTPDAQAGNSNGGGGLSSKNKSIIGGVVGGVGGAILLGGLAVVAWRLRSKRRVTEDDADLMAGTGAALGDKPATQPFQSNLEQYHNPGGRPNAAANF